MVKRVRATRGTRAFGMALTAAAVAAMVMAGIGSANSNPEAVGDGGVSPSYYTPLGVSADDVNVVLQLSGDPVTVQEANSGRKFTKGERQSAAGALKAKQDALAGAIAAAGGTVVNSYQYAYNGIRVRAARSSLDALGSLKGVVAVRPLQVMQPDNVRGVPYIGGPAAWDGLNGFHGEGVKIAVIDTGIDYTHADFGGPGTVAAYNLANSKDTLDPDPNLVGPLAPRVKGGVDLVGDDYNASAAAGSPALTPHPDPNPLDCNGHGSHVAGTAAGSGILANGSTYTGSYNASTISSNSWIVAPGVAPKADIYSVRVFGCAGSTDVTVDAIEWAVANGMDVINMSLGSPFGSKDDPSAAASTNAAMDGVIVVTSAGNNNPSPYIVGSPSTADGAISTAAVDAWTATPGATLTTTPSIPGNPFTLINANGAAVNAMSGPVVVLKDNPATTTDQAGYIGSANEALGCSPASYTFNGIVPGGNQIAVVQRGTCARVARGIFGQQAGAAAVIMTNNATGFPPFEGRITSNPDTGEQFTVTIPFLGANGNQATAGTSSARLLAAPAGTNGALASADITNANYKGFASFSSGGPRSGDSALKPDVSAPGVSVISVANGTGNGGTIISGTSMASPHAAGAAALVRQAHPSWSVADIKAAIVNTGDPSLAASTLTPYKVSIGGTGAVQVQNATKTQTIASAVGGTKFDVALSFGFEEPKGDYSKTKTIKLTNRGSSAATFAVSQTNAQGMAHTVSYSASTVTVPAGGSASVDVTLNVPAATAGRADAFREVAGLTTFTPTGGSNNGVALRVPYYLVERAQAAVSASANLTVGGTAPVTVSNSASAAVAGNGDMYAWGLSDGKDNKIGADDIRAVGVQSFASPSATIPTRRLLVFAVNTWKAWSAAPAQEFDIYVDVDGDGKDDYIVVGADQGAVQTGTFNGVMGAFVFSTRSAGSTINFLADAPANGSTALLPVFSSAMCRTNEPCLNNATHPGARISYHAIGFDSVNGGNDPVDGVAKYNPWHESITTGGFADSVAPGASDASNSVAIDAAEWALTPALGLMVVTEDNKGGPDEANLIPVK
jgi:minor extracellular serine protease Vpr